jgi:AmiR/NasT family two-component response regulator
MTKPKCKLIGEDGNIFNLMGVASRILKRAGLKKQAEEMVDKITKSKSYEEALGIIMEYVEVE